MFLNTFSQDRNIKLNILLVTLILTLSVVILGSLNGCSLTQTVLVRQSITPIPEEAKGVLYVAQSKKILVGIEGTETLIKVNASGYYLVHKNDLKAMIKAINNK